MQNLHNAVWLYLGKEARNAEEIHDFTEWCERNQVQTVLVHLQLSGGHSDQTKAQVQQIIDACSPRGIDVHGMVSSLQARSADRSTLLFQDRSYYCVDAHGISLWDEPIPGNLYVYDPRHPEVVQEISERCAQLIRDFPDLRGIHLDFVRYFQYESKLVIDTKDGGFWIGKPIAGQPLKLGAADGSVTTYFVESESKKYNDPPIGNQVTLVRSHRYCFCPDCLKDFERQSGISIPETSNETAQISAWILDRHPKEWADYRSSVITNLVSSIRRAVRAVQKDKQLSAAVWYNAPYGNELRGEPLDPESAYEAFGQAWWQWAAEDLVDFVCPMDYWLKPESYGQVVKDQVRKADGNIPVYAGILRGPEYEIDAETFAHYQHSAAEAGARGICFFHYGSWKNLT